MMKTKFLAILFFSVSCAGSEALDRQEGAVAHEACSQLTKFLKVEDKVRLDKGVFRDEARKQLVQCLEAGKISPSNKNSGKVGTLLAILYPHEDLKSVFPKEADVLSFINQAVLNEGQNGWHYYAKGLIHTWGWFGAEEDDALGCKYLDKAYAAGNQYSAFLLYFCFNHGTGVPTDYSRALELLEASALAGDPYGMLAFGLSHWYGDLVKEDLVKAEKYMRLSLAKGNLNAADDLIRFMFIENTNSSRIEEAFELLEIYALQTESNSSNYFELDGVLQLYIEVHLGVIFEEEARRVGKKLNRKKALSLFVDHPRDNFFLDVAERLIEDFVPYEFMSEAEFRPALNRLKAIAASKKETKLTQQKVNSILASYYGFGTFGLTNMDLALAFRKAAADAGSQVAQSDFAWDLYENRHETSYKNPIQMAIQYALKGASGDNDLARAIALNNIGVFYDDIGDQDKANEFFRKALEEAANSDASIAWPSANLLRNHLTQSRESRWDETAQKYYERAKEEQGSDVVLSYAGNQNLSYVDWLRTRETEMSYEVFQELGWAEETFGNYKEAYKYYILCSLTAEGDDIKVCENDAKDLLRHLHGEQSRQIETNARREFIVLASKGLKEPSSPSSEDTNNSDGIAKALIFFVNDYKSLPPLNTPKNDAERLGDILTNKYGFTVTLVANPNRKEIISALNKEKGLNENDKLLIYFAGHGKSEEKTSFWLPVDADPGDDTQWIEDNTIKRKLSQIPARNILVVADTCFSGNLTRGLEVVELDLSDAAFSEYEATKTRVAISSGGDEPVLDTVNGKHSIFSNALISFLNQSKKPFSAQEAFTTISREVREASIKAGLKQTPQYGSLFDAGHEGLGFVFYPKK